MIIVKVDKSIEKALKEFKKKYSETKTLKELRDRKNYKKPSVKRREEVSKAIYIRKKNDLKEDN